MTYKRTGKPTGRPKKQPPKSGERPSLTEKQWKALKYELKTLQRWDPLIWGASLRRVASIANVSHTAVAKWRRDPAYRQGLIELISELSMAKLVESDQKTKVASTPRRSKRQADAALDAYLNNNWSGPIKSPIDGQMYYDRNSYFQHIQENPDVQWVGDLPLGEEPKERKT